LSANVQKTLNLYALGCLNSNVSDRDNDVFLIKEECDIVRKRVNRYP